MANLVDSYVTKSNKLDGTNYVNWKFKMQMLMEGHNIGAIVNGKEAKPTSPTTTPIVVQDWEKKDKIILRMSVKHLVICHIKDISTSNGTWSALKGLYEIANSNRILFLKRKLLSIKIEVTESVSKFLSRIKELRDKLADVGE